MPWHCPDCMGRVQVFAEIQAQSSYDELSREEIEQDLKESGKLWLVCAECSSDVEWREKEKGRGKTLSSPD